MKQVQCINERTTNPGQLKRGARYWLDEDSVWKDSDGEEFAEIYTYQFAEYKYRLGIFKTSHFSEVQTL